MTGVKIEDFPLISVSQLGNHRLVDEESLNCLIHSAGWFKLLDIPQAGPKALAILFLIFCDAKGVNATRVAKDTGLHRKVIRQLASGNGKTKHHTVTLEILSGYFGPKFRAILEAQGLLESEHT